MQVLILWPGWGRKKTIIHLLPFRGPGRSLETPALGLIMLSPFIRLAEAAKGKQWASHSLLPLFFGAVALWFLFTIKKKGCTIQRSQVGSLKMGGFFSCHILGCRTFFTCSQAFAFLPVITLLVWYPINLCWDNNPWHRHTTGTQLTVLMLQKHNRLQNEWNEVLVRFQWFHFSIITSYS